MTLLNPAGLIFGIFVAGLVLLYLWERRQRRVDVPSMLLWEVVPESVVRRSRFQPDSLFWLQLAGLVCLVVGLANPYFEGSDDQRVAGKAILIVDLSASMQVVENDVSRLERAREAASRIILSSPPETEVMLIGAAREPRILAPFTREHDRVVEAAAALEASDVSANLEPVLATAHRLAHQAATPTDIHVFTDLPRASVGTRWRTNVNWWSFGENDDNVAIAGVETSQGILQSDRQIDARVSIRNFGARNKHVALNVAVGGETIGHELFTIPPYGTSTFHFPHVGSSGVLEATIESDDALAVDNSWRTWVSRFQPVRLALLGATDDLREALMRIEQATHAITVVALDDLQTMPDPSAADVAIYHRVTPESLPRIPALLIAPPADVSSQQSLEEISGVQVLDWIAEHPILRGVEPRLLRSFETVKIMAPPEWSETVLAARAPGHDIPILAAGRPHDRRVAILTADIEGGRLLASDHETTLLLFLNLIDWLAGQRGNVPVLRTGESRPLDTSADEITELIDPRGRRIEIPKGPNPFLSFDRAGIYHLHHREGPPSLVLANFQDSSESTIGRRPEPPFRVESVRRGRHGRNDDGLQHWFYLAAVALLVGEWLAAGRLSDHG